MAILRTEGLTYVYGEGTPFVRQAITDVTLDIEEDTLYALIGHTGSGKSTLVQHLNGLIRATSGKIYLDGVDIWAEPKKIRDVRFKVGLVFQYPEYQLFDETVAKDIAFGPKNLGLDENEIKERVEWASEVVGLSKELLEKSPFDLSGGEKRRAAIAGVLAMKPKILILDEPTAGLDPKGRDRLLDGIAAYRKENKTTVILVSHSMEDVARVADKVIVMNGGKVEMTGTTGEVFSQAERLTDIGLNVPMITRVMQQLRARGANVPSDVLTVEQARDILVGLRQGGDGLC